MSENKFSNIFYGQSGGPTAVINVTACGLIQAARSYGHTVYAGQHGILGVLQEELIDTSGESETQIELLRYTPGSAFGSCRYKLSDEEIRDRIVPVLRAHHIRYFFYQGGGDSQDTTARVARISRELGYSMCSIGLPKTIDNDLCGTDTAPGFGSAAKYIAVSTQEAARDVRGMCSTSTQVFILEVMGRHTGWLAASSALGMQSVDDPPHVVLFPEIPFDPEAFLSRVRHCISKIGYCVVVVAEGLKNACGQTVVCKRSICDAFGHSRLGGVGSYLMHLLEEQGPYKCHLAIADYLQRSARHLASAVDVQQAYEIGQVAVHRAIQQKIDDVMLTINMLESGKWEIGQVPLSEVANRERSLPLDFIDASGFHITPSCRTHLMSLIQGEDQVPYAQGVPQWASLNNQLLVKKMPNWKRLNCGSKKCMK